MKKIIISFTFMFVTILLFGCQITTTEQGTLTLPEDKVQIYVGDTYEIEAILEGVEAEIVYSFATGLGVIELNENVVTGIKAGNGSIKVTVVGHSKLEKILEIEVLPRPVTPEITLPVNKKTIEVGDIYTINATSVGFESPLSYRVKDENGVIELNDNVVTALKPGVATVIVDFETADTDIYQKELVITVIEKVIIPVLEVEQTEILLQSKGETHQINAVVTNIEANIIYEIIEGSEIIKIEEDVITALNSGDAVVKISVEGFPEVYKEINVVVAIPVDEVAPNLSINPGALYDIKLNWGKEITKEELLKDVSSIDDVDGDITKDINVKHEIDNKKYGKYVVVYESVDKSGNIATMERTVEVIWDYAVEFIGHMGSYYGVANSEEAFIYAASVLQYQALETDIKQTSDGVFVCCHDDTFGGKTIASTTWAELKEIEVSSSRTSGYPSQYGEMPGDGKYTSKICSLERYLEICKEYGVKAVVELKSSNGITNSSQTRMPALMEVIEKAGMLDQTIFLGSSYNCLIWVKQNGYEYIPCQYLVNSCESDTYLERCKTYGLDISINTTGGHSNSAEWIAKYQDAGLKVSTYTYTQYVDYDVVQEWIDLGVDYVTCDWHSMDKLILPDNSDIVYHTVKFYDQDNNLLKEAEVREGRAAPAPDAPEIPGYRFTGWSESISSITSDLEVKAQYEIVNYTITYDSNLYVLNKSTWASKDEFVSDFYNDLFDWVAANYSHLSTVSLSNGVYTVKTNSTTEGTVTFSSAQDIRDLGVYYFERTLATLIYKPISGSNSADYVPVVDNNYFLNTEPYRSKYIECNAYFLKAMQTAYSGYSFTYQQASNNRVQIFFRFHQWCNGTTIAAFNAYPNKYAVKYLVGVDVTMPTDHVSYTINDSFVLSNPVASIGFLGWYLSNDGSGEPVTEIKAGSTGNLILYAKWEKVEIPDVYSNITYELDGGTNDEQNPAQYLEGVSTQIFPATKPGYVFKGWSKEEGSNSYIVSISELTSGDITLYANYEYEVYSIKYEIGEGSWGNQAEFTGSAATSIKTTRTGDFWGGGYATDIYLDNVSSHPKATWSFRVGIAYSDVMGLYSVVSIGEAGKSFDDSKAEWVITISSSYNGYNGTADIRKAISVGQGVKINGDLTTGKVTFEFYDEENIVGGSLDNYIEEYTIATLPLLLPIPKAEGKVFKGWTFSADLSQETFTSLPIDTIGNVTLYAVFE